MSAFNHCGTPGGEPAMPSTDMVPEWHPGLTKRERYAAMAMQGLLACPDVSDSLTEIAEKATICADRLLAALAKEESP